MCPEILPNEERGIVPRLCKAVPGTTIKGPSSSRPGTGAPSGGRTVRFDTEGEDYKPSTQAGNNGQGDPYNNRPKSHKPINPNTQGYNL